MPDIRQSINYGKYLESMGWTVERISGVNYFIRHFWIVGSILKIQRPSKLDFQTIDKLCRKYGVFHIVIEPDSEKNVGKLKAKGYRLSGSPFLPSKTLQIDLSQPEKEIFGKLKKDARAAVKRGGVIKIKEYSLPSEIKKWRQGWKENVSFKKYVPGEDQLIKLRKSFPQSESLFLASHNIVGRIIGGALFTISRERDDTVCYYWYGFSGNEGRTSLSQYPLLYHAILWAKSHGCKTFDFEGIYDPRFPNSSWKGFTHFKKSFGGTEVTYPGAFVKYRIPYFQ
jgi:hypothetical protein